MENRGPPPPYTHEQIRAITSLEDRLRARAELESYIARMKRENDERYAAVSGSSYPNTTHHTQSGFHNAPVSAPQSGFNNAPGGVFAPQTGKYNASVSADATQTGKSNAPHRTIPSSKRGGYASGGRGGYHPYQRPHPPFKNRSVVFGQSDSANESLDAAETETAPLSATKKTVTTQGRDKQTEFKSLCPALTTTGVCSRRGCLYQHDANKQALCKRWLYKSDCSKGDFCPLSHEASPHNAPTCLHFQDSRCKHEDCRFAHIRLNPAAINCEAFGRLGYCEKGDTCAELHAHECPSFANSGVCSFGDKCWLGHIHRASRMRKTTRPSSVVTSPAKTPEEDLDNDENAQKWLTQSTIVPTHKFHQFTQQADFVPLDDD